MQIARTAFKSPSFYLYAPLAELPKIGSALVLKAYDLDVTGGDAVEADPGAYDTFPSDPGLRWHRHIYWQRSATNGHRLVLVSREFSAMADIYELYSIGENVPLDEFRAAISPNEASAVFVPVIKGWRPPFVLQERDTGLGWSIDVGEPYNFLGEWRVHVAGPEGAPVACTVRFRPDTGDATTLLPKPVQRLARLLDQTMGQGLDEGTLRPTAHLRNDVAYTWANVALRPWAVGAPYNSRAEVDSGLQDWARKGASYRKLYDAIQREYPVAVRALARYYQMGFDRPAGEAREQASYVLDVALRAHYSFHRPDSSERSATDPNPWGKQP